MEFQTEQTQPEQTQCQTQHQTQPTPTYATYADYSTNRLTCTPFEQKTIPGTGPEAKPPSAPQYYFQIPFMYNFGTPENRILNDFYLEFCEMETALGIQSKAGQSGRMEHSIMCKFDNNNSEHTQLINTMDNLYLGAAFILNTMKVQVGLRHFNMDAAEATGLKRPIYRPYDKLTGDPIQGRAPSMFLKLFRRGKAPFAEETLFTGLDEKPIPWTLLQNVEMKFIPLVHVKRMYVGGGKASIQMEVISAVVTSIRARGSTTRQTGTIQRLQTARPELADMVAGQLAKLTLDRQDQLLGTHTTNVGEGDNQGDQATFEGIVPTGQRQPYNGQTTGNNQAVLPPIPALGGTQPTMQDFTAGAPVRAPVIPAVAIPGAALKAPSPTTPQYN